MSRVRNLGRVFAKPALAATVLLWLVFCTGCEIEGRGGGDRTQWQLNSLPRDPDYQPNLDVQVTMTNRNTSLSIRP